MKKNQLSIPQIEAMYQNGAISDFEYADLMRKCAARMQKAMSETK
jgi:hypothetical protein